MSNAEQVINGLIRYADNEIMIKLPTAGKWVVGTAISIASTKANDVVLALQTNPIANVLGVVDKDGNIDVETLIKAMKESADRYGNINVTIPLLGNMSFSSTDIDALRNYL